jgi:hypothetical protein
MAVWGFLRYERIQTMGGVMKVGDLVVEHIDDRIGTIIKIEKGKRVWGECDIATVLLEDGSILGFPTTYLGRYK